MGEGESDTRNDGSFSGSQITVLEARDHIGGRVVTFRNEDEGLIL